MNSRLASLGFVCAIVIGLPLTEGAAQTADYKGLAITPKNLERSRNVGLQDCPPGANIVRGVIRPNEGNEFATIEIDVKVLSSFEPVQLEKPVLYDEAGNAYKTGQSFRELNEKPSYSCNFSFRVPKGTKVTRFEIEEVTFDIGKLED